MSNRKLSILAVVAVFMIVLSVLQWHVSGRVRSIDLKQAIYLIQGLDPADIGSITIGKEPNVVQLVRRQNQFVVADKDNYPASTKEINTLISSCLDIKIKELYTSDVSNHTDLGVTEEDARYLVKFFKFDTDTTPFTGVVVGKSEEQGSGAYVRLVNNNNVYFTEESPWIKTNTTDYMKQDILSVKSSDITSVDIISSKDKYALKRQGDDSDTIVLENIPQGKNLKTSDGKQVLEALTNLRFDDVLSANKNNMKFNRQFICRMKDSTVYTIKIAQKDNKTFITCSAEFTDTTPVTKEPGQIESEEELKKKEAKLLARDNAGKFTKQHKDWIYQIPDFKAVHLTKKLSDLLEELTKEELQEEKPASI